MFHKETEKDKKKLHPVFKGCLIFLVCLGIMNIAVFINIYSGTKWETKTELSRETKAAIAKKEMLLPDFKEYIDRSSRRGMRDYTDVYETIWFESIEDLFEVCVFNTEEHRMAAMTQWQDYKVNENSLYQLFKENVIIYQIPESLLPLADGGKRTEDVQWGFSFNYYIVEDLTNSGRVKLICEKQGF